MAVYITGDTHGRNSIHKIMPEHLAREGIKIQSGDTLIILGDFGIPFVATNIYMLQEHDREIIKELDKLPYQIAYLDGNHDNHTIIDKLPSETWNGGTVGRLSKNIIHLKRGELYTIDNISICSPKQ